MIILCWLGFSSCIDRSPTTTTTTTTRSTTATKTTTVKSKPTTVSSTITHSSASSSSSSQTKVDEIERTGFSHAATRDVTDKYVSQTRAGDGLSSGTVAGIAVGLTGITVIILLIAFVIRFRKNDINRNMRDPSATSGAHLVTFDTTCRHEDTHPPATDGNIWSTITTGRSNEENVVFYFPSRSDTPRMSDTAGCHVTCHKDNLQQKENKGIYSELDNYADSGFSNNNTDIYNRLLLNASSRGRDSPAGSDAVNYDHLSLAGQVPTQSPPQLSDDSNADDYSHICRQGEGGLDLRSASTVEDTYHHLQSDDPDEYNRLRRQGDEEDKHSACPVTENYSHLQLPVHTSRTQTCNDYELAKVISESNYAKVRQEEEVSFTCKGDHFTSNSSIS